jgi:peroxiredoxin Q/BCP
MVKIGEAAPEFTAAAHDGSQITLAALRGRKVLLWFYPAADTPGWTIEGRGFRDHQSYFDESNIQVLGVSFDDVAANAAFASKNGFNYPLLTDADHRIAIAYGASTDPHAKWPARMSFLINEAGAIERVYDKVDPRDHPARVLADILGVWGSNGPNGRAAPL